MRALVYTDTQKLIYREEKNPKSINGESIIKVSASGICGSDMHAYHGKDNRRIPPLILGHEISGTVDNGKESGKKVVLFSLPGAFTPTCSTYQLPDFEKLYDDELKREIDSP